MLVPLILYYKKTLSRPIFNTPSFIASTGINKVSTHKLLGDLVESGILTVTTPGKARRPTVYSFPKLLE